MTPLGTYQKGDRVHYVDLTQHGAFFMNSGVVEHVGDTPRHDDFNDRHYGVLSRDEDGQVCVTPCSGRILYTTPQAAIRACMAYHPPGKKSRDELRALLDSYDVHAPSDDDAVEVSE